LEGARALARAGRARAGGAPGVGTCLNPRWSAAAGCKPADERNEDDRDDDADDERQPTAGDERCDEHRDDADRNGEQPPHGVAARVQKTTERSDDRPNDDEPDEVHAASVSKGDHRKTRLGALEPGLLLLELLVREDPGRVEISQLLEI